MKDFTDLIAKQPKSIHRVFISDLHLSLNEPAPNHLGQAFLDLLDLLVALPNLKQLFILGDWFEIWLGDDVAESDTLTNWLEPIIIKLKALSENGCQILIMHGNRDFLIGQNFCARFGGRLIKAPYYFDLNGKKVRLEHGDALCTDDKKYQRFRKIIQNPLIKKLLIALPMRRREQIAQDLRQQSKTDNAKKSMQIMDVNEQAVLKALENADILLHGHTHRPWVHDFKNGKQRLVLGDWRKERDSVIAEIAIGLDNSIELITFQSHI